MVTVPKLDLYIGGSRVPAATGERLPVINPATEQTIGSIPAGCAADVDAAVAAATKAFPTWAATPVHKRAAILKALAEQVRTHKDELSHLETLDMGKPLDEAAWDMDDVADCFDFFGDLALKMLGPDGDRRAEVAVGVPEFRSAVLRQPVGVAGLITPWNYPLLMATWKLAPALAAGCAVVLKPSEHASLTCLRLADLAATAGVPAGVLNVVTGLGPAAGAPLATHPGLHKVAFTGSNATGRAVARAAAGNLTPCTLELGGKSAVLVFEDADVDRAVEWVMFGCFWTNGQICSATSRLLVHRAIAPQLLARLKARAEIIRVCDPLEKGCRLGPLVCASQHAKVQRYIRGGVAAGATLLTGGPGPPAGVGRGFYTRPTVFSGVTPDMEIWREEIFGPVLGVMEFDSEAEAVALANASEYGLAGAVIGADAARNKRVAAALDVGIVWVNCSQPCFCQAPWGGRKASGIGRELGTFGLESFLSPKQITEYVSPDIWDWYAPPPAAATSKL